MKTIIRNVNVVNEGKISLSDVVINERFIEKILPSGTAQSESALVIDGTGKHLFPGVIDDQVHFREPGLTHKGELYTEARSAIAGGVTSYMEMPNTSPAAVNRELLEWKYQRAAEVSLANYSFYIGASNSNLDELLAIDPKTVCGVKIFMGSSTGDLVVDNADALEAIFREVKTLIATHCESDPLIRQNAAMYREQFGEDIPPKYHPVIRNAEACYASSSFAVELATKYNTRLHILHISTARELSLFRNDIPLSEKHITSEACIHHLWFSDADYESKGNYIKWNPAVKTAEDRMAVRQAVIDGRIDVVATDHAPHTMEEKAMSYFKAPSGGPLVQHTLVAMLELVKQGIFTLELVADKMSHKVADMFSIDRRGYIREGYYADLVLVDLNNPWTVLKENLLYKCGWSPFEGTTFHSRIEKTFVNGHLVYDQGVINEDQRGMRMIFNR